MCLYNSKVAVENFIKKCKIRNKKYVWMYKNFNCENNVLIGMYRKNYKYKPGWNKSNSKRTSPYYETRDISLGIHVCKEFIPYSNHANIKVKCYLKDLIGVSSIFGSYQELVFSKIWIPKKSYDKAVSEFKTKTFNQEF